MFKRRLAILGAVGVLVVTGLTGSALAGTTPPVPEGAVTCTDGDGKVVYSGRTAKTIEVVKGADGKIMIKESGEPVRVRMKDAGMADGDVLEQWAEEVGEAEWAESVRGDKLETIRPTHLPDGAEAGAVRAVPAEPLPEGAERGKDVIMCRSEAAAE